MRKKEKKFVDYAEATRERIIAYSNNDADDYHLVAENQDGDINIFFEKENICYCKDVDSNFRNKENSKAKFIQYIIICNYIYILWLLTNNLALGNFIGIKEKTESIIFFSVIMFIIFLIPMLKNKYRNLFMLFLLISIISDNILVNFALNFVDDVIAVFKILLLIAFMFAVFVMLSDYTVCFIYERKRVEERGKHSAEHMMCNYIEKYQTYPKNVKELKKVSRFTLDCGGLYGNFLFEESMSLFMSNSIVMLISMKVLEEFKVIDELMAYDEMGLIFSTIFLGTSFIVISILIDLVKELIYSVLIILSQIVNTLPKRKLKYRDLKMAQMLSEKFFEWQYPNDIEPNKKTN